MSASAIELRLDCLCIPFKVAFKHASAERRATLSVWVEARAANGTVGFGEGAPRDYVSGETLATASAFFHRHRAALAALRDLASLRTWLAANQAEVDANPAVWCAIETALLDLFSKQARCSIEHTLGLPLLTGKPRYSAILGAGDVASSLAQFAHYRALGMTDFKVKIGLDRHRDHDTFAALRARAGTVCRFRLDANNAWRDAATAIDYLRGIAAEGCPIEEPLAAGDIAGMRAIASALGSPIVLDESVLRREQLDPLAGDTQTWIVNVRVSKMGGLLRSLALIDHARALGLRIVVGAQVGETSVLTRMALTAAMHAGRHLYAQEGAFGTHLLQTDVCTPALMFGAGGILDLDRLGIANADGIGLDIVRPSAFLTALP